MLKKLIAVACVVGAVNVAHAQLGQVKVSAAKENSVSDTNWSFLPGEGVVTVDISGLPTGGEDPPADVMISVDVSGGTGVDQIVSGIGWDVVLDAFDPSWLSEAAIDFNGEVALAPGAGDDFPGLGVPYSSGGIVDLTLIDDGMGGNLSFVAPGGIVDMTLFESFDDVATSPDGMWLDTSIVSILAEPVPEPSAWCLLSLAGLSLIGLRRRR